MATAKPTIALRRDREAAHGVALESLAHAHGSSTTPNPGTPLDLSIIRAQRVNRSAVERRAGTLESGRAVTKQSQAEWLLRAITLMDLTTLAGDDTPAVVRRLCAKAQRPLPAKLLAALGASKPPIHVAAVCVYQLGAASLRIRTAAVCVYHAFVPTAVKALEGSGIPVAAVSAGFPAGLSPFKLRVAEVRESVAAGAREIDIVIMRAHVLTGDWAALYDEVRAFREAAGDALLKAILATGELKTLTNVARASHVCMMAGADFIKTSTGKEAVNATLPAGLVMCRAIREHHQRTGFAAGLKPAGGIRTAKQALDWMAMVKEELGQNWLRPELFRLGASTLLGDIERQLERAVPGRS